MIKFFGYHRKRLSIFDFDNIFKLLQGRARAMNLTIRLLQSTMDVERDGERERQTIESLRFK